MILTEPSPPTASARALGPILAAGERRLARGGLPSPRLECELLLAHALGVDRSALRRLAPTDPVPETARRRWRKLLHRRLAGEPLAYLVGSKAFWTLRLAVRPGTLVPRPETEALVAFAEGLFERGTRRRFLDLGTGSGALALALGTLYPAAEIWATDRSDEALALAAENARRAGRRLVLRRGHWFAALPPGRRFALIVSNPPYLAADDAALRTDGLRREPRGALVSGEGGFEDLRTIARESPRRLEPGGWLLLEHAPAQEASLAALLRAAGFVGRETIRDPGGVPVGTAACRPA